MIDRLWDSCLTAHPPSYSIFRLSLAPLRYTLRVNELPLPKRSSVVKEDKCLVKMLVLFSLVGATLSVFFPLPFVPFSSFDSFDRACFMDSLL